MSENEKLNSEEIRDLIKTLKDLALELRGALDELTNPVIARVPRSVGQIGGEASRGGAVPEAQAPRAAEAEAPAAPAPAKGGEEGAGTRVEGQAGGQVMTHSILYHYPWQ